MRVLLGVAWYFPDSLGGSEVYVRGLARHLQRAGVDVHVAAPTGSGQPSEDYEYDGIPVHRYPGADETPEIGLARPEPPAWANLVDRLKPDVADLHSLTTDLELPHLRAARQRCRGTVVTLHLPALVCARGTLMRFGTTPCDGDLARQPCTACRLEARGVPALAGQLAALVPASLGPAARRWGAPHWLTRGLEAESAHDTRRAWLAAIADASDRVVAVSGWLADVLVRNHVPREKVRVCRQGVEDTHVPRSVSRRPGEPLRVGFVGRYDVLKGLDVLIEAAARIPRHVSIEFHVWASARSEEARAYEQTIRTRAAGDRRVVFHGETANAADAYASIHVLAVPSVWFETGPLVVLEAQAAGLPVVGSDLGGIPERVMHGRNGWLVPHGDPAALADVFVGFARDSTTLDALRYQGQPRTMADAAQETLTMYRQLLGVAS